MTELRDRYDVVVVGGGAAGLNGALMLARSRRSVLVIDAGAPRNAPAAEVHGLFARDGVPPAELLERGRVEVRRYGGLVVSGEVVDAVRGDEGFTVTLADGRTVGARRLLVTTGLSDELPDVPGLRERWGGTSSTVRTVTDGKSVTRRSGSSPVARCPCTRRCCSAS